MILHSKSQKITNNCIIFKKILTDICKIRGKLIIFNKIVNYLLK